MLALGTVSALIAERCTVHLYCGERHCGHHAVLDLEAYQARFGPDAGTMRDDLRRRLFCGRCGSKGLDMSLIPDSQAHLRTRTS